MDLQIENSDRTTDQLFNRPIDGQMGLLGSFTSNKIGEEGMHRGRNKKAVK